METLRRRYLHIEIETSSGTLKDITPFIVINGVDNEEIDVTPISGKIDGVDFCEKCGYVVIDGTCLGCEKKNHLKKLMTKNK